MICLIAVLAIYSPMHPRHGDAFNRAIISCEEIVERVEQYPDLDPVLVVAVASEETRFQDRISSAGAVGPLQVLPVYWCPARGACNPIDAGLQALTYYLEKCENKTRCALTGYAGQGRRARAYAERVLRRASHIRATLDAL